MQSPGDIINRIIDLDSTAENIRTQAREEAEKILSDTNKLLEEEKEILERRIAEKTSEINAVAGEKRKTELAKVHDEFSERAESIKNISPEKAEHGIQLIFSKIKGSGE